MLWHACGCWQVLGMMLYESDDEVRCSLEPVHWGLALVLTPANKLSTQCPKDPSWSTLFEAIELACSKWCSHGLSLGAAPSCMRLLMAL